MNNTEKKLDALIDALGFDVEANTVTKEIHNPYDSSFEVITNTNYKLTKRIEPSPEQTKKMRTWLDMGYRLGI